MFAVRNAVTLAPRLANLSAVQRRTIVCTPPAVRISLTLVTQLSSLCTEVGTWKEKIIHGLVIYGASMVIPLYVSTNIKNYRGKS